MELWAADTGRSISRPLNTSNYTINGIFLIVAAHVRAGHLPEIEELLQRAKKGKSEGKNRVLKL
jgi:hypothetical protein